jgi:hypothetical protein
MLMIAVPMMYFHHKCPVAQATLAFQPFPQLPSGVGTKTQNRPIWGGFVLWALYQEGGTGPEDRVNTHTRKGMYLPWAQPECSSRVSRASFWGEEFFLVCYPG